MSETANSVPERPKLLMWTVLAWYIPMECTYYDSKRARAPELVLPTRETLRRYASMDKKEVIEASVRVYETQLPMFEHPQAHPILPNGVAPAHSLIRAPQSTP